MRCHQVVVANLKPHFSEHLSTKCSGKTHHSEAMHLKPRNTWLVKFGHAHGNIILTCLLYTLSSSYYEGNLDLPSKAIWLELPNHLLQTPAWPSHPEFISPCWLVLLPLVGWCCFRIQVPFAWFREWVMHRHWNRKPLWEGGNSCLETKGGEGR